MNRSVILSKTAEKKLENVFIYLTENWSLKVKADFVKKLDKTIEIIKNQPEIFPESNKESGLHKCVITKHIILYYRFDAKTIKIITFFDTRQHPHKLKEQL